MRTELAQLPADTLGPLVSVASGDEVARTQVHPWISEYVFAPLAERRIRVVHHELSPGPGIDVAGDLHDARVMNVLAATGIRSVLCCNLLEHVDPRRDLAAALTKLVAPGGFLIVTVPHRFPYHPDPIDTMFRPSVRELAAEFPALTLRTGEEVACGTLWRYLANKPDGLASTVAGIRAALARKRGAGRRPEPLHAGNPAAGNPGAGALPFLVRSTSVTCAVFERTD